MSSTPALNSALLKQLVIVADALEEARRAEIAKHVYTTLKWKLTDQATTAHVGYLLGSILEGTDPVDLRHVDSDTPHPLWTLLRRNMPHDHPVWRWILGPNKPSDRQPDPQQTYLECGGTCCPNCGSTSIQASAMEQDGHLAEQMVDCQDCHANWWDQFRLTGFRDLQLPSTEPDETDITSQLHGEDLDLTPFTLTDLEAAAARLAHHED